MARAYFRQKYADVSIATMRAALETMERYPYKLPRTEAARISSSPGISSTRLYNARLIIKRKPELVSRILNGELSIYIAYEMTTKGERVICPTCNGVGHLIQ